MSFSLCQSAYSLCVVFFLFLFLVGLPEIITVLTLFSPKYFEFHSYTCFIWIVSDLLTVCAFNTGCYNVPNFLFFFLHTTVTCELILSDA